MYMPTEHICEKVGEVWTSLLQASSQIRSRSDRPGNSLLFALICTFFAVLLVMCLIRHGLVEHWCSTRLRVA
jgi:hypothetical protein